MIGGWNENENIDAQDDFILSQRLKETRQISIAHLDDAIITHRPDVSFRKLIRSWYGYGLGYGFRFWRAATRGHAAVSLRVFSPPLVYVRGMQFGYFVFACMQRCVTFCGYIVGLLRFRKRFSKLSARWGSASTRST